MCLKPFYSPGSRCPFPGAAGRRARFSGPDDHAAQGQVRTGRPTQFRTRAGARPPQRLHSPGDNPITTDPPSQPVAEIIKRFAERETEFRIERDNYTYTQAFAIQTIDDDGRPDGEYRMVSDIIFTPDSKRFGKGQVRAAGHATAHLAEPTGSGRRAQRPALRADHDGIAQVQRDLRGAAAGGRAFDVRV